MTEAVQEALHDPAFGPDKVVKKSIEKDPYSWSKYERILEEYPLAHFVKAGSSAVLQGTRYPRPLEKDITAIRIEGSKVALREKWSEVPVLGKSRNYGLLKDDPIPLEEWIKRLKSPK